jgi:two-component system CheB/CheR fusion protein
LCISGFTSRADEIADLMETDIGRPLKHFAFHLKYDGLITDAKEVIKTLIPIKKEVETKNEQWYSMRIIPYRTMDDKIDGAVITFQNITEYKT